MTVSLTVEVNHGKTNTCDKISADFMFECSDSMSYYGQETTCMVPIVIGKCDYSYFLEFGYSFFIVGAKPHSSAALVQTQEY